MAVTRFVNTSLNFSHVAGVAYCWVSLMAFLSRYCNNAMYNYGLVMYKKNPFLS